MGIEQNNIKWDLKLPELWLVDCKVIETDIESSQWSRRRDKKHSRQIAENEKRDQR